MLINSQGPTGQKLDGGHLKVRRGFRRQRHHPQGRGHSTLWWFGSRMFASLPRPPAHVPVSGRGWVSAWGSDGEGSMSKLQVVPHVSARPLALLPSALRRKCLPLQRGPRRRQVGQRRTSPLAWSKSQTSYTGTRQSPGTTGLGTRNTCFLESTKFGLFVTQHDAATVA